MPSPEFKLGIARVDGRYALKGQLGSGSYATVFRAEDIITKQAVAVKLEPMSRPTHLKHEYHVLCELKGGTGFPCPLWFGREGLYNAMVIDKLGPSLDELLKANGTFQLHNVAELGLQMLTRLEYIHSHDFVHHDIKPQNMLMGLGGSKDILFIIDFGITKQYRDSSSRVHIPMDCTGNNVGFIGTPAFASVNSHRKHQELSQRDDLEGLAYTLLFLYSGSLPWLDPSTRSSRSKIRSAKLALQADSRPRMPTELLAIMFYARSLEFGQKPNYDYVRSILHPATSSLALVITESKAISAVHTRCAQIDDRKRIKKIPQVTRVTRSRCAGRTPPEIPVNQQNKL